MLLSLAEGFFCQTTTSEERDLAIQGVEIDPFLLDDSAGHYLSRSSQDSDEDIARYVTIATSQLAHLEKVSLFFSSLSIVIWVYILHPYPSFFLYGLSFLLSLMF